VLIALGLPFAGIKFNSVDQTALPVTSDARIVNETLKRDFGWPKGAVLNVVVEAPASAGAQVQAFADSLKSEPGVTQVTPPQPLSSDTWKFDVQTDDGEARTREFNCHGQAGVAESDDRDARRARS